MKPLIFPCLLLPLFVQAEPFYTEDFEDEARIKAEWSSGGGVKNDKSNTSIAVVATDHAASGQQALALKDEDTAAFGRWFSKDIELPAEVIERGTIKVSWKALFSTSQKGMRTTVIFSRGGKESSREHFFARGDSDGWAAREFHPEEKNIPIPPGATHVSLSFVSAGDAGVTGSYYFDDITIE